MIEYWNYWMYNRGLLVSILNIWFRSGKHCWDFSHSNGAHATDGKTGAQGWAAIFPKAHSEIVAASAYRRMPSSTLLEKNNTSSWEMMVVCKHRKKHLLETCCLFITMLVNTGDPKQKDMVFAHEKLFIN